MEKRALLAVVLSLLVIIVYQYFFIPEAPVKPPVIKEEKTEINKQNSDFSGLDKEIQLSEDIAKLFEDQKKRSPYKIFVETSKYSATIDTQGAKIISWKLKDYILTEKYENNPLKLSFWQTVGKSYKKFFMGLFKQKDEHFQKKHIDLFDSLDSIDGSALKMVSVNNFDEKGVNDKLFDGIFETNANQNIFLDEHHPKERISLKYISSNGLLIEKVLTFYHDTYKFDAEISIKNLTDYKNILYYNLILGPGLGSAFHSGAHKFEGPVTWLDGKKIKDKPKKDVFKLRHEGDVSWTAMTSNYFVAAAIPHNEKTKILVQRPGDNFNDMVKANTITSLAVSYPKRVLNPGSLERDVYSFYFGPKEYEKLKKLGIHLEEVIDFGFFKFLAKPLIWLLNMFYSLIPNYGMAIILLTILIKLVFWPLTDKSFRSMKEMQEIQPKLASLKGKYKNDPKKLNEEILGMYKQKGVNPMGGCLPLLLQIPVFFALYEGLMVAIEMRGAHFILWIKDLSVMDPLLITPILMGVTMYIQQKMTPMTGEATQVKMMTMLPLIFTVFFLGFPSGLVIYWLLNNLLTIGQHHLILKKMGAGN